MHLTRLFFAAFLALGASLASADEVADAKRFITELYSGYAKPGEWPRRGDPRWYDASLIALLNENVKANADGVPYLGGDPLCNCMDATGLQLDTVTVAGAPEGRVAGDARLRFGADRFEQIHLVLMYSADGWRVWDIGDTQTPSLRQALIDDTASAIQDKAASGRK